MKKRLKNFFRRRKREGESEGSPSFTEDEVHARARELARALLKPEKPKKDEE